jgi:hypothetical protein
VLLRQQTETGCELSDGMEHLGAANMVCIRRGWLLGAKHTAPVNQIRRL